MAKLILKSPYIKSTGGASGYMKYIATRERVEIIPDDRPPTRKQEQLIAKLVKDFPDTKTLYEYEDYIAKPTKVTASEFITLALESNWDSVVQSEQYMKYIATRPRAERFGSHGLFSDDDAVSLDKAMTELENYTGNVWTHIISLKREDAERLGYRDIDSCHDPDEKAKLVAKRDDCTKALAQLRKDKKTAARIIEDNPKIKENILIEENMRSRFFGLNKSRKRGYER